MTVTGVVARIDPAGTVSNGVVNYLVRVDLDPTEATLRTDMTANARIVLDTHTDVLAVPGARSGRMPRAYYVNVVGTDGTAQRVDVTPGYTDGDLTEVVGQSAGGSASVYQRTNDYEYHRARPGSQPVRHAHRRVNHP